MKNIDHLIEKFGDSGFIILDTITGEFSRIPYGTVVKYPPIEDIKMTENDIAEIEELQELKIIR